MTCCGRLEVKDLKGLSRKNERCKSISSGSIPKKMTKTARPVTSANSIKEKKMQEKSEEYKAIESLLTKLAYLGFSILVSLLLIIGGITKLTVTALFGGTNDWAGLGILTLGVAGLTTVFVWLSFKRR